MTIVPEGKIIRRLHGGPDALKTLLRDLKRYAFTGYVRTRVGHDSEPAEGVLAVKGGALQVALRSRGPATMRGNAALKEVWTDSRRSECAIELHAKVDVDALVRHLPDALVERPRPAANRSKLAASARREGGPSPADQVRTWRAAGFDTRELESKLAGEPQVARSAIAEFARGVDRALALQQVLDRINRPGIEAKAAKIRGMLRDIRLLAVAEAEIEDLRTEQGAARGAASRPPPPIARGPDPVRSPLAVIARTRSVDEPPTIVRFELESDEAIGPRDEATNLIRRYGFNSFVVGPSNRFAHAAALAVARSTRAAYNPLFITSGTGLGKTHLLSAIGNAVAAAKPETRVVYLSVEVFANEFRQAKAKEKLPEFRGKHRSVDLFLLDDVHFLSGQGDVQEELFHTFDALTGSGKQIVLTSDRHPKDIPELEDRLVSRFESGLVADIQAPEFETRMAILRRRATEVGGVPDDILAVIAEAVSTNVRELGGALNQVTARASLLGQPVTLALAAAVLEDLKASPGRGGRSGDPELQPGRAYLVEELRPEACFRLFARIAASDGGLLITRLNPTRVRERYDLGRAAVLWLTDHEGAAERTISPQLERLMYEIRAHLESGGGGAILIDGVEYLVSNNTFEAVLKFLRALIDAVSESPIVLLVSLSTETLGDQEVKTLERELEVLTLA